MDNRDQALKEELGEIEKPILSLDFARRGENRNIRFTKPLSLSSTEVLKGIKEDDWEDAFKPIHDVLGEVMNLDWNRACEIVKAYRKSCFIGQDRLRMETCWETICN